MHAIAVRSTRRAGLTRRLAVAVVALALALAPSSASAQIDPYLQSYGVYQNEILVGEIYREDVNVASYTEHWVLYPRYLYPSDKNLVTTVIHPSGIAYRDTADFFARVSWQNGSRYVKTTCTDGTSLPRR